MSFWSAYKSLSPKTRMAFGLGLMGWALFASSATPYVEEALGMAPSLDEQKELERKMAFRVERVEKKRGDVE